jgi:hypothetical protein
MLRRRSITETFCYGDVLFRRRSVTEKFCMETFCRGDVSCGDVAFVRHAEGLLPFLVFN